MRKISRTEVLAIDQASARWEINLPLGALFPEVNAVYGVNKELLQEQYTVETRLDKLIVNFSFDAHSGYVKYSYLEYDYDEPTCPTQQGVVVNVNNAPSEPVCPTQPEEIKVSFTGNKSIKVAELDKCAVFIKYCLTTTNDEMEAGELVIVKDTGISVHPDRYSNSQLLNVDYSSEIKSDGIYLNILPQNSNTYNFNYLITKL